MEARKFDDQKNRLELLPPFALEEIAKGFTFGAKKYDAFNYVSGDGLAYSRIYGALLRHLSAWYRGEELDPESGLPHLTHAGCCLMMLMETIQAHPDNDDRPKHYKRQE